MPEPPYAEPRHVERVEDCYFYHTMDLPGVGLVQGSWDLRGGARQYLGEVPLAGKRVLEVGPGSGYLSFEMERRGAHVVACDLSEDDSWDVAPFGGQASAEVLAERARALRRLNNSFWLAHRAHGSAVRVVYGPVYQLPETIGLVEVATLGCVLLHLRDPFLALQRALGLTRDTVIVTEPASRAARVMHRLPSWSHARLAASRRLPAGLGFMPDPATGLPTETWWRIPPWTVARMLGVLGFTVERVGFHSPPFEGRPTLLYTLVAHRNGARL